MSTDIPAGTKLLGITVANGTATAGLSSDFQSSERRPRTARDQGSSSVANSLSGGTS